MNMIRHQMAFFDPVLSLTGKAMKYLSPTPALFAHTEFSDDT